MFFLNVNRTFTPDDLAVLYKAFDELLRGGRGETRNGLHTRRETHLENADREGPHARLCSGRAGP